MKRILFTAVFCISLLISVQAMAGHSRYTNGVEGVKAASLPPEGFYWRVYNVYYAADKMKTNDMKSNKDFEVDVFALVNRFIWTTPYKVLGADLTMDAVIPLIYSDVKLDDVFNDHKFGLGDILVEPAVLHWHGERWDTVLGMGLYMPTGEFKRNFNANPGKGYWSMLWSAGGTLYFDAEKTWSASVLARYENHISKQEHTRVTPGDDFHFEWGIGKSFSSGFEVGVAGYCQWQLKEDKGRNASPGMEKAYAAGPEISYTYAPWGLNVTLRSLWEFENKNTTQGNVTSLIFTKAF
ncbi:transporter [Desulfovibrio sp. OttesenSCG-928-O18]|nr:transporter [Desulfovibrio sp. OttesenSCG-928-O18]